MTPTSRELRRTQRRFIVVAAIVVLALVGASVAMASVALDRGPRLRAVTGDASLTVSQRDLTLTLRTDQPLDSSSMEGLRVEPAAPADIDIDGASVRVRFTGLLDFDTAYRIVAPGLRSRATGATSAVEYAFTTPSATVTVLERGGAFDRVDDTPDRVVRHDLSRGTETTVLSAPRIQEYADTPDGVVALVLDPDGGARLQTVDGAGAEATLSAPGQGDIRLLRASADAGRIGYVFTGPSADGTTEYTNTLFLTDPAADDPAPRAVLGIDGMPLRTDAWFFVPGSAYLVAEAADRSLVLVDATGVAPPRALGQLGDLRGILPGTTSVVVSSDAATSILDLTNGSVTDVAGAPTATSTLGSLVLSPTSVLTWTGRTITRSGGDGSEFPLAGAPSGERLQEVCVSPSGRHLAVGSAPDAAPIDGYPARADRVGRSTRIVDADSGETVAELSGTRPDWCA
ncbi:hypothetical protein CH252_20865 [Rhodococcus sp. 06-1477-1B]|nr:hypothetical protein CH252_20865 [Rhodococcus sp. 06-1477-1B]